jgi:hypothetical protein
MSSRDWHDPPGDPLYRQKNLFNELKTRELQIIWEHSFAKVPAAAGITDKFFEYSPGVARDGPSAVVGEGEYITTKESGDYGGGQPVIAGAAFGIDSQPTGDQDAWVGYSNQTDGVGVGVREFAAGEGDPGASTSGPQPYVFFERFGNQRTVVPQEHWNLNTLQAGDADEGPPLDLTDGVTARFPHACYFHSAATVELGVKLAGGGFALVPVHEFNHQGGPMWSHSDLPVQLRASGTQGDGWSAKLTTVHYEGETGRNTKRTNGQSWTPQFNGGAALSLAAYPDWTYVMAFRKRAGWERADVTPQALSLNADQNVEVQITVGGSFSNTAWDLPEDTGSSECATEYDLATYDLASGSEKTTNTSVDAVGEREWVDVAAGDKQTTVSVEADLEKVVLASDEPVALLTRPAASTATGIRYAALRNGGGF